MALRVALAQVNAHVGDIAGNRDRVLDGWRQAQQAGADLVVFPELMITGYPPEDLLLKPAFVTAAADAIRDLARTDLQTVAVVGAVLEGADVTDQEHWDVAVSARDLGNAAVAMARGEIIDSYVKGRLPNFGVFDEARYFRADATPSVIDVHGTLVGLTICEDAWTERGPVADAVAAGAEVVVNLNASPYHRGKRGERERWAKHHATTLGVWFVYVNLVGGQDELVFDGDSFVVTPNGVVVARGRQFAEDLMVVDLEPSASAASPTDRLDPVAEVWEALVLGTGDYCRKNGFSEAVIGLSGGIDSAVTAAVAVDALGADAVRGVAMPSPWSSDHSVADARALADNLGIRFDVVEIAPAMHAFSDMLAEVFAGLDADVTEENIQARIRGILLMALSNKFGSILLTTGNKSEMAVGYATLYGDMAGGFAVLKDVPKLLVYELARHRNKRGPAIPENTIDKPPSAELRPDQFDSDSLPPYEVLDPIIEALVEDDLDVAAIVARGFDEPTVRRVARMVDVAEYKRRQSAPGVKITDRAFGKDRRVPITNRWKA